MVYKIQRDGDEITIANVDDDGQPFDPPREIRITVHNVPGIILKLYRTLDPDGMLAPMIERIFAKYHRFREEDKKNPPPWKKK